MNQNISYATCFAHLRALVHPCSVMFVQSPARPPSRFYGSEKSTEYTAHWLGNRHEELQYFHIHLLLQCEIIPSGHPHVLIIKWSWNPLGSYFLH